jgi:ABC-type Fe3+-siderophore transport system permease subunit
MPRLSRAALPLVLCLLLVLSITVGVSFGAASIPFTSVWSIVANKIVPGTFEPVWSAGRESIVWDVRFPRVILGGLVGAGLALTGAVLQPLTRNPLADPHLLGVSSGAAFGAILALLHTGLFLGLLTVPVMAFAGALAATAAVPLVAKATRSMQADRLVLSGVAVAFSGAIGFVGLMVPHFVRLVFGSDNVVVLPLSAFTGALMLIWADLAARLIMAPEDMPIGIVTGIAGGLSFIWILRRA